MKHVYSKDGTPIAFDRSGAGPAIILVGGALSDRAAGVSLAEQLASHFTVFTYDRRGRGDSGDTAPYALLREVEDIAAIIDEAGGKAFVLGHSSGAVLALEAAAQGLAMPKLALFEPPFIVDDSRPPLPGDYVSHLNELTAAGRRGEAVEYFMTAAVGMPAEVVAQMRKEPFWAATEALAHTISYDGTIMGDTMSGNRSSLARFASITVPTLVIDGGASPPYMHQGAQALADVLPHARHRRLEGQDHGPAPEVLAPVLVEFFNVQQA